MHAEEDNENNHQSRPSQGGAQGESHQSGPPETWGQLPFGWRDIFGSQGILGKENKEHITKIIMNLQPLVRNLSYYLHHLIITAFYI